MPSAATMTQVPSDAPAGQQKKGVATKVAAIPFARSSKYHTEQGGITTGIVVNSAVSPTTLNVPIPSYGFLSGILVSILATGGTGSAAVYYEDAPWSFAQTIAVYDVNGVPIWGPFGGYQAFLASKYGSYRLFGPDGSVTAYGPSTPTALGNNPVNFTASTGNFGAVLPLWMEFGRDGMGCLANNDASARYNLQIQIAAMAASASGPIYTTAPTGYPTLSVGVEVFCRSIPPAVDLFGAAQTIAPPAVGTTAYWSQQSFTQLNGAQTLQLTRVGNLVRNHILVFRDTSNGTRATADASDIPPTIEFDWDANIRYVNNVSTFRQLSYLVSGMDVPKGVIWLPYTTDPDALATRELGDEWMATVSATKFTLRFTPAGNCSLLVLTNDIVAASEDVYAAGVLSMNY